MRPPLHLHAPCHTDLQQLQPSILRSHAIFEATLTVQTTSKLSSYLSAGSLSHAARRQTAPPTTPAYHLQLSKPRSLQRCESINTTILLHIATPHPARQIREFRIVSSKDRCCCRRILLRRQLLKLQSSSNHESLTDHRQLAC
jgi:hypothetical protein